jgi:small subunit ribosomal protein S16
MVKLRLRRQGRKGKPFYYIVAADARAPRDGRFIERIGSYNPNTNPATIDLNLEDAVRWLGNGAVPTDTCKAILSYKGAMYKHHLNKGVTKGALTQDQAEDKFTAWMDEKEGKVAAKADGLSKTAADAAEAAFKKEQEIRAAREKVIAEKNAPTDVVVDAEAAAEGEVAAEATDAPVEAAAEAPVTEEVVAEAPAEEAPAAEKVAEAPAAEATPEVVAEAPAEEAPAADTATEDKA